MLRLQLQTRIQQRFAIPWLAVAIIVSAASGCQSPQAPFDPFLTGRTTIPPPSTAAQPAGAAPYYPAAPGLEAPATLYTPPGSTPVAVPVNQNYLPRGSFSYPQSQASPAGSGTTLASAATAAGSVADSKPAAAGDPQSAAADRGVQPATFNQPVATSRGGSMSVATSSLQTTAPNQLPPSGAAQPLATSLRSAEGRAALAQLPELGDFPRPSPATAVGSRANSSPLSKTVTSSTSGASADGGRGAQASSAGLNSTSSSTIPGYGYDEKYQRLQGKLEFSPSQQRWKLRYIPIDGETDAYGGSVVLPESEKLQGFAAGDFVVVQGRLNQSRPASEGFSPPYLIERLTRQ